MVGLARRIATIALSIATSIAVAYSLFGLGFMVCTLPQATSAIGGTFSGWEHATYPEADMEEIAEAVRSFSIEGTSSEDLYNTIFSVMQETEPQIAALFEEGSAENASNTTVNNNTNAIANNATAGETSNSGNDVNTSSDNLALSSTNLAELEDEYSLPRNALSHLQDCTPIFTTGRISVGVVGGFALVGLIVLGILAGRKRIGGTLIAGSALVIGILVALGIWAAVDFDGIFTWMHTLFFAQGSWVFNSDSLLITLFPEAFWAAMAGLWIISSVIFAFIAGIVGKILSH